MRPMLDPARDLAGATPEKLARALLRNGTNYDRAPGSCQVAGISPFILLTPKERAAPSRKPH